MLIAAPRGQTFHSPTRRRPKRAWLDYQQVRNVKGELDVTSQPAYSAHTGCQHLPPTKTPSLWKFGYISVRGARASGGRRKKTMESFHLDFVLVGPNAICGVESDIRSDFFVLTAETSNPGCTAARLPATQTLAILFNGAFHSTLVRNTTALIRPVAIPATTHVRHDECTAVIGTGYPFRHCPTLATPSELWPVAKP